MTANPATTSRSTAPERRDASFRHFLASTAIYMAGPVLGRALGLLVVPLVVVALGADEFGRFEVFSTAASAFAALVLVGLDLSAISLYHRPGEWLAKRVFPTAVAVSLLLSVVVAAAFVVFAGPVSELFVDRTGYASSAALVGAYVLVSVVGLVARAALRAKERAGVHSAAAAVTSVSTTLLVLVVLLRGASVPAILVAYVGGGALGSAFALWFARDVVAGSPDRRMGRSMLRLGVPQLIAMAALWGGELLHRFVLIDQVGPEAVGSLGIGARVASVLSFVVLGMQAAWHPRVFDLLKRDDGLAVVERDTRRIALVLCGTGLAISVLAYPLTAFLGQSRFDDTVAVAGWMTVMVAGTGFVQLATLYTVTHRHFGDVTISLSAGLAVSLLLAVVLVPTHGAIGTAIAMAAAQWIAVAVGWALARKRAILQLPVSLVVPALLAMPACIALTANDVNLGVRLVVGLLASSAIVRGLLQTRTVDVVEGS